MLPICSKRMTQSIAGLALLLLGFAACRAADTKGPLRWAIVSNVTPENAKAVDLLIAKLSAEEEFQLVERDEVAVAVNELGLQSFSTARATADRSKFGKRLSADVLMIIDEVALPKPEDPGELNPSKPSVRPAGNTPNIIRVVTCDVRSGARLHVDAVPESGLSLEKKSERLVEVVQQARTRLAKGLHYVVGISPFLSQDLTHDFDNYQASLARLLEDNFSEIPGVAVIEREEAMAIWQELTDRPDSSPVRLVPLIVEGEYKALPNPEKQNQQFLVTVSCRYPAGKAQTFKSDSMPSDDLPKWIASLPRKAIDWNGASEKPLDAFDQQEQFNRLVKRADNFEQLGEWYHAMGLCQAALLLKPRDAKNRINLITNERSLLKSVSARSESGAEWLPSAPEPRLKQLLSIYRDELGNEEFLIRNSLIDKRQAVHLIGWLERSYSQVGLSYAAVESPEREMLEEAEHERKDFLWNVSADAFKLPNAVKDTDEVSQRGAKADLQDALVSQTVRRIDREKPTVEDLDFLYKLWTTRVPDRLGLIGVIASVRYSLFPESDQFIKSQPQRFSNYGGESRVSREQWAAFVDRLAQSDFETARVVGKIEQLVWNWFVIDRISNVDQIARLAAEADEAAQLYDQYPVKGNQGRTTFFGGGENDQRLEDIRWQIERLKYQPDPFAPRQRLDTAKQKAPPRATPSGTAPPTHSGRITLTNLLFKLPVDPVNSIWNTPWPNWVKWDKDIDVVWNPNEIWWMTKRDTFTKLEIKEATGKTIDDVQAREGLLWIASKSGEIWIIDKHGNIASHVTAADGLPPADHALRVYTIDDRRACVVGSFGKDFRAWCATVDISADVPKVNVFHEAKNVPIQSATEFSIIRPVDDTNDAFVPRVLIPHTEEDGKKVLYVLRSRKGERYDDMAALVIDLATFDVKTAKLPRIMNNTNRDRDSYFMSYDGHLLHSSSVTGFKRIGDPRYFPMPSNAEFVKFNNKLYLPTMAGWDEYDPQTETVENLCDPAVPLFRLGHMKFALSANYGIVGWDCDSNRPTDRPNVYQLQIDEPKKTDQASEKARIVKEQEQNAIGRPPGPVDKQEIPLAPDKLKDILDRIDNLLAHEPKVPDNALALYSDGYANIDQWLPLIQPQLCYRDPPETRQGLRWLIVDGRVVRVQSLNTGRLPDSYTIWYGDAHEPVFVRQSGPLPKPQGGKHALENPRLLASEKPPGAKRAAAEADRGIRSWYYYGLYDDRGLLSRVIHFDASMNVMDMTVYENADRYQGAIVYQCDAKGRVRTIRNDFPQDEKGQRVDPSDKSKIFYSFRYEQITSPARAGLAPVYPIPD